MKKELKKPENFRKKSINKVALFETVLRGSVDENCSAPGSVYQKCKSKCC